MSVKIRTARADEASSLSELALRSKGYWGYSERFLEECRAELTYTPQRCVSGDVFVADHDGEVLGFAVIDGAAPHGELQALFVDVGAMGRGVGGDLLRHALSVARDRGFISLTLESDPGAEPFYVHHGAVRIGETPSGSIPPVGVEIDVDVHRHQQRRADMTLASGSNTVGLLREGWLAHELADGVLGRSPDRRSTIVIRAW